MMRGKDLDTKLHMYVKRGCNPITSREKWQLKCQVSSASSVFCISQILYLSLFKHRKSKKLCKPKL